MATDGENDRSWQNVISSNLSAAGSEVDFEEISQRFTEEYRKGKEPSIEEYAERYPEFASDILELFPSMLILEKGGKSASISGLGYASPTKDRPKLERLKNFKILREIGHGGMGVVYEAWDETLERMVALKVMKIFPGEKEETLLRFQREARIAGQLHHTNIVPVYDCDVADDQFYYAMQLIDGRSLDQYLRMKEKDTPRTFETPRKRLGKFSRWFRERRSEIREAFINPDKTDIQSATTEFMSELPEHAAFDVDDDGDVQEMLVAQNSPLTDDDLFEAHSSLMTIRIESANYYQHVADLGIQAADALRYAHRHHVVHRDIKPSNLIVDRHGCLWITDFGLARSMEENDNQLTRNGQFLGTLRYLAPEALKSQFSPKSDVYSLGLTLYELMTLTPAYGESQYAKLIAQVTAGSPIQPRKINPKIPRDLETIVLKAIDYNPENRYTAGEMADDLRRFIEDRPIKARRVLFPELLWRWARRNKLVAGLVSIVILLALFVLTALGVFNVRLNSEIAEKNAESTRAQTNLTLALEAFDEIFTRLLSDSDVGTFNLLDDSGAIYGSFANVSISRQESEALDEMLDFYVKFAYANRETDNNLDLQLRSAQAFYRSGLIRVMQAKLGSISAFDQSFQFYIRSLESAQSPEQRRQIAYETASLVIRIMDSSPPDRDVSKFEKYCEKALDALERVDEDNAIDEITAPLVTSQTDRLKAQLRFARSVHRMKSVRRDRQSVESLFSEIIASMPSPTQIERQQRDLDFVFEFIQRLGTPDTSSDLELIAGYYTVLALWRSTLRQTEEAFAAYRKGANIVAGYKEKYPGSIEALNVSLGLEYAKLRTVFECQIYNADEGMRRVAIEEFRKLEDKITNMASEDPNASGNVRFVFSKIIGYTILARLEASLAAFDDSALERAERLLDVASDEAERFTVILPHFAPTHFMMKIQFFYTELFIREQRFDEAQARLESLDRLFNDWQERSLTRLDDMEKLRLSDEENDYERSLIEKTSSRIEELRVALKDSQKSLNSPNAPLSENVLDNQAANATK
ncbi:MAG: serine/threonine protein kinase [Thermoguttaceae bacterium]|jgi:serine/threonine protein kinase